MGKWSFIHMIKPLVVIHFLPAIIISLFLAIFSIKITTTLKLVSVLSLAVLGLEFEGSIVALVVLMGLGRLLPESKTASPLYFA